VNPLATLVIDDAAGRMCAKFLGLHVVGTLGLVARAKRSGWIDSARLVFNEVHAAGLWLDEQIIEKVLRELGESPDS